MTGVAQSGSNSVEFASSSRGVAGVFDDHGLQAEAQAEGRQLVLTGELQGTDLAVDATDAEAPGTTMPSTWSSAAAAPSSVSHLSAATHLTFTLA